MSPGRMLRYLGDLIAPSTTRLARRPRGPWVMRSIRTAALILIAMAMVGLCWWWVLAFQSIERGSSVHALEQLVVRPATNQAVEIGRRALVQRSDRADAAEPRHVEIEFRQLEEKVYIRNLARSKRLGLRVRHDGADVPIDADRWRLSDGSCVQAGRAALRFAAVTPSGFDLMIDDGRSRRAYRYVSGVVGDGFTALQTEADAAGLRAPVSCGDGVAARDAPLAAAEISVPDCRAEGVIDAIERIALGLVPEDTGVAERVVLFIGGDRTCRDGSRFQLGGIGGVEWRGLQIVHHRRLGGFYLAPGEAARGRLPGLVLDGPDRRIIGFDRVLWPVADARGAEEGRVTSFIAGRTRYAIEAVVGAAGAEVRITPEDKVALFRSDTCPAPAPPGLGTAPSLAEATIRPGVDCPEFFAAGAPRPAEITLRLTAKHSPLAIVATGAAVAGAERAMRIAVVILAIAAALWFSGLRSDLPDRASALRGKAGPARRSLLPLLLTVISAAIALAPELAALIGQPLDAREAMLASIANWGLAGVLILWFGGGLILGAFWIALMLLVAIGSLSLAAMAASGDSTQWAAFLAKHKALFLDVTPPLIVAAATSPLLRMRPVIEELVVGTRPGYGLLRVAPAALLVAAFAAWIVIGTQQGVLGFQPVEAGKFAAAVICAAMLVGIERASRQLAVYRSRGASTLSMIVLVVFIIILFFVPVIRSDYSPALILVLLITILLVSHVLPAALRYLGSVMRARIDRRRVPQAFRPRVRLPLGTRLMPWMIVLGILAGTGLLAAGLVLGPDGAVRLVCGGMATGATDRDGFRTSLLNALGASRRVPTERCLTWIDLDLGGARSGVPARTTAPETLLARYRDLGFQVLRSRVAIGNAPCGNAVLAAAGPEIADRLTHAGSVVLAAVNRLAGLAPVATPCGVLPGRDAARDDPRGRRSLLDPGDPLQIPVVQSDFAAAWLIGHFGVGAGFLLLFAQAALLAAGVLCYLWVRQPRREQDRERVVRRFLAIIVAGGLTLLVLHWTISWSNVLGLLPVMGQPMTLLSAATSYHLFMAMPAIVFVVLAMRYASVSNALPLRHAPPRRR